MKNYFPFLLLIFFTLCAFGKAPKEGLLWKISGNGLTQPSYLFGTWHGDTELRNQSFLDSVPGFHASFRSVKQFMCERTLDEASNSLNSSQDKLRAAMLLPKDTTYSDLLDKSQISILDTFLTKKLKVTKNDEQDQEHGQERHERWREERTSCAACKRWSIQVCTYQAGSGRGAAVHGRDGGGAHGACGSARGRGSPHQPCGRGGS